jgi:hypothetical protein
MNSNFNVRLSPALLIVLFTASLAKSISIDGDVNGNDINDVNLQQQQPRDYYIYGDYVDDKSNELTSKRDPEIYRSDKRNIISALRSKMRRSNKPIEEIEEKYKFAPVLSVGMS